VYYANQYTIYASSNDQVMGDIVALPNEEYWDSNFSTFTHADIISLRATPTPGHKFLRWELNQDVSFLPHFSEENQTIDFRLIEDVNATAIFAPVDYNISVSILTLDFYGNELDETSGKVFFEGLETNSSTYRYQQDANLSIQSFSNYEFIQWLNESNNFISSSNLYLPSITSDRNLIAQFEKKSKDFEDIFPTSQTTGGEIIGIPEYETHLHFGREIEITASPQNHWKFTGWSDSGTNNPTRIITVNDQQNPIQATFTKELYQLHTLVSAAGYGQIVETNTNNPLTTGEFTFDETIDITAIPNNGKVFKSWESSSLVNFEPGFDQKDPRIEFKLIKDLNLTARFESVPLDFSFSVNTYDTFDLNKLIDSDDSRQSSAGSIDTGQEIKHGDNLRLLFKPNHGYRFKHWIIDDLILNQNEYYFDAERNSSITAVAFLDKFDVTINPKTGTIDFSVVGEETLSAKLEIIKKELAFNSMISVEATPSTGRSFQQWEIKSSAGSKFYSQKKLSLIVKEDFEVIVHFENEIVENPESTFLFIPVSPRGSGSVTGNGEVIGNQIFDHNITAIANEGYEFVKWETDDLENVQIHDIYSSVTTLDFAHRDKLVVRAIFKKLPRMFNLSLLSSNTDWGRVEGSGDYLEGSVIPIRAFPEEGYEFFGWDGFGDLNKQVPYSDLLIEYSTTLTANFRPIIKTDDSNFTEVSSELGNGWWQNPWFGFYWKQDSSTWAFHQHLGWIYMNHEKDGSIWIWISKFEDWFWTNQDIYPYIYADSLSNSGWFYVDLENSSPFRLLIYRYGTDDGSAGWLSK